MIIRPISLALTRLIILMLTTLASAQVPSIAPPTKVPPTGAPETGAKIPQVPTRAAHALTKEDVEAWLDGFTPYALQRGDVAGAVVVVVKDGQVLLAKGYGYADVVARKPVDPERTLFRAGSVSKLFTWTAVMQLVEQGKLDLDADINTYLDFKIPSRNGKPVTLRNLMTHTPGFDETIRALILNDTHYLKPLGEALRRWVPPRVTAAGSTPAYSNYGAALAGYIVEHVSRGYGGTDALNAISYDPAAQLNVARYLREQHQRSSRYHARRRYLMVPFRAQSFRRRRCRIVHIA